MLVRPVTERVLARPLPQRRVLEELILPHYAAQADLHSVLFVGAEWDTRHYEWTFFPHQQYWTIGWDPLARRFGSRHHLVAPLERLDEFFPEEAFDLIICDSPHRHGLDGLDQCERAFAHCYTRLREGGELVLGWDDVESRTGVLLEEIASLRRFARRTLPQFGTCRVRTRTPYGHTFDFYVKRGTIAD
jgi:hypothetical protein